MRFRLSLILLIIFCASLSAQEESDSIDDLFLEPTEDIETETEMTEDLLARVEEKEYLVVEGYFGGTSGLGVGFFKVEDGFSAGNYDLLLGATADSHISFDVNPHPSVRINAVFESVIDQNNIDEPWSTIYIDEFFLEYNLFNTGFFSFGKFKTNVGHDFIDKEDGTSVLFTFPTVLSGLNFYINADESVMVLNEKNETEFDYTRLFYGTWVDVVFGKTRLTTGLKYKKNESEIVRERLATILGVKTEIFNFNLNSEVEYYSTKNHLFKGRFGAYYIYGSILVGGQYYMQNAVYGNKPYQQGVEFGFRASSIFDSPFTFEFITDYDITARSGVVAPALSISPWKYITINLSVPYIFGEDGFDVFDDIIDDTDEDAYDLVTSELSVFLSISLKVDF